MPDPLKDLLKGTGPPVPNMGGIPSLQVGAPRPIAPPAFNAATEGFPLGMARPPSQGLPEPPPLTPEVMPPPPPEPFAPTAAPTEEPAPTAAPAAGVNISIGAPPTAAAQAPAAQPGVAGTTAVLPNVEKSTLGDVSTDLDGQISMRLNDLGKREWVRKRDKMLADFGDFPGKDDPNAPQPKVEPGTPTYNPYTDVWVGLE